MSMNPILKRGLFPIISSLILIGQLLISTEVAYAEPGAVYTPPKEAKLQFDYVKLKTAKTITVFRSYGPHALGKIKTEDYFKATSCAFTTSDPKYIGSLTNILANTELQRERSTPYGLERKYNVLLGIYFHYDDGDESTILLSMSEGYLRMSTAAEWEKFKAPSMLHSSLMFWAAQISPPTVQDTTLKTVQDCEDETLGHVYGQRRESK